MGYRRKAREFALQILYQSDFNRGPINEEIKNAFWSDKSVEPQVKIFAESLINGVIDHREEIDVLIQRQSKHWSTGRMAMVDRNILRFAIFELSYLDDIPAKVTINEAIEIAKIYGNEESGAFVNGILDHIHHDSLATLTTSKNKKTD